MDKEEPSKPEVTPRASIIIPCVTATEQTVECLNYCLKLNYPNYEILLLPDSEDGLQKVPSDERIQVIPTGKVTPISKRFIGSFASRGELLAFLDSDAFPTPNWLRNAAVHFKDSEVAAVAGPSLTPSTDSPLEKLSGLILSSSLVSGTESVRYKPHTNQMLVSEAPTCNLIVLKSIFVSLKNMIPNVWPGEEITLCGVLTKDMKKKILYDPKVIVYHHRRPLFMPYFKQIWNYGAIKGSLMRSSSKYIRPIFIMPSVLVIGIAFGFPLALMNPTFGLIYLASISSYGIFALLSGLVTGLRSKSIELTPLFSFCHVLTHLCYGTAFLKGFFQNRTKRS